jgi:hypothetical protein
MLDEYLPSKRTSLKLDKLYHNKFTIILARQLVGKYSSWYYLSYEYTRTA